MGLGAGKARVQQLVYGVLEYHEGEKTVDDKVPACEISEGSQKASQGLYLESSWDLFGLRICGSDQLGLKNQQ